MRLCGRRGPCPSTLRQRMSGWRRSGSGSRSPRLRPSAPAHGLSRALPQWPAGAYAGLAALLLGLAACGGGGGSSGSSGSEGAVAAAVPVPTVQETQCHAAGWTREVLPVAGLSRLVLWKAPPVWSRGAIVVMHGGGGSHTNFCVANVPLIAPQVRFAELALARGFAVFLLDSSDQVRDTEGRLCGKVWDDEVRDRPNLDLPFLDDVLARLVPGKRPPGSRPEVFLAGHSSGGFMAVRAATRFADRVTAVAPVASGDPYGWFRDCTPRSGDRSNVFGAGFDNETRRQIIEPGACAATAYPNEKPWDGAGAGARPVFRRFHHQQDGIVDASCVAKLGVQLQARGYAQVPAFTRDGGPRSAEVHYWLDDYHEPLLDFFAAQLPP